MFRAFLEELGSLTVSYRSRGCAWIFKNSRYQRCSAKVQGFLRTRGVHGVRSCSSGVQRIHIYTVDVHGEHLTSNSEQHEHLQSWSRHHEHRTPNESNSLGVHGAQTCSVDVRGALSCSLGVHRVQTDSVGVHSVHRVAS